jgi:hypothetical protein
MINVDICEVLLGYCGYNVKLRLIPYDILDTIIINNCGIIKNNRIVVRYAGDIHIEYKHYRFRITEDFVMKTYKYRDLHTYIRKCKNTLDYVYRSRYHNIYIYIYIYEDNKYCKLEIDGDTYYYYNSNIDVIYNMILEYSKRYIREPI